MTTNMLLLVFVDRSDDPWTDPTSGNFLWNHYRDALGLIGSLETELSIVKEQLKITDDDLARFFSEEVKYLNALKAAPMTEALKIQYIQALNELSRKR